jgi:peptide/nickel transport system permease protein
LTNSALPTSDAESVASADDAQSVMPDLPRRARFLKSLRPWLKPKIVLGGTVVFLLVFIGVFAPVIAPYDPNGQNLINALRAPGWFSEPHFLGTDHVGRDIMSRIIYGARISLVIAATVVVISGVIGIGLGAISGFFAGRTDFFIQKLVEVVWAFPPLLLAIAIMAFFGQSLLILIVALVVQRWIPYCRVARGQALSLRTRDFVDAARSLGASNTRIITRHVLPNLVQAAMVIGTFAMATAIIAEASLSFLGLGVPPAIPTWGSMLADGRTYISTSWWLALFPGLCIFFTVLGINMLGDGMRDLFDPRLKRSGQGMG